MVTVELMATCFQIVEPPLSTLLGVGLQIPLTIGVVDLEDEDATVVLLPGFMAELLDATDEVSAFIDEELGITGPFLADEKLPLASTAPMSQAHKMATTHTKNTLQNTRFISNSIPYITPKP